MTDENDGANAMAKQMENMQKLLDTQLQIIQMSRNAQPQPTTAQATSTIKRIDAPVARYDMTSHEFRSYKKDCKDFKALTNYSDLQTVLQMRIHMDAPLKQAIDANYGETWDTLTVANTLEKIETLLKSVTNPIVHRKEFDNMVQRETDSITEFVTRLKICAEDCDFVCPHAPEHNLTEYHLINRIRSGIRDKTLQQELLQKSDSLKTLKDITDYCTNFESAKSDQKKLTSSDPILGNISSGEPDEEMSPAEVAAAISMYKRSKKDDLGQHRSEHPESARGNSEKKTCKSCGYEWPHAKGQSSCPAKNNVCRHCNKKGHFEKVCSRSQKSKNISSIIIGSVSRALELSKTEVSPLPKLDVRIGHDEEAPVKIPVVADTGAQIPVAGPSQMKAMGIEQNALTPPPESVEHVGGGKLEIMGCYPIYIIHNSQLVETSVYFAKGVKNMYISVDLCKKIRIVHDDFPNNNVDEPQVNSMTTESEPSDTKPSTQSSDTKPSTQSQDSPRAKPPP